MIRKNGFGLGSLAARVEVGSTKEPNPPWNATSSFATIRPNASTLLSKQASVDLNGNCQRGIQDGNASLTQTATLRPVTAAIETEDPTMMESQEVNPSDEKPTLKAISARLLDAIRTPGAIKAMADRIRERAERNGGPFGDTLL